MANTVEARMDQHIEWLRKEITACVEQGFEAHEKGKAYLEVLRTSLAQWERLRHR